MWAAVGLLRVRIEDRTANSFGRVNQAAELPH
jgi:hypothetical protein